MRIVFAVCFLFASIFTNGQTVFGGFIKNKGQIMNQFTTLNDEVLYQFSGNSIKIQLRKNGYSYEVFKVVNTNISLGSEKTFCKHNNKTSEIITHRVDVKFKNSLSLKEIKEQEELNSTLNYVINGQETYNVQAYKKIVYKNVYENIDVEFIIGKNNSFKYNFVLNPGANINEIKMLVEGANNVSLTQKNELEIETSLGIISDKIPFSYYTNSPQQNNPVYFKLNKNEITFISNHNSKETFIIDPSSNLIWGNYLGGAALDYQTTMHVDANDNIYVGGYTFSTSNIATTGVYQTTLSGSFDSYIIKSNTSGTIQWGTYFGGSNVDVVYALTTDAAGNIYAGGDTFSTSNIATAGAHQTVYGGGVDDCMIFKFTPAGQRIWSTYYGGLEHDIIGSLTIDNNNDLIITGHTDSNNNIATAGAYNTIYATSYDCIVAKFDSAGVLQWGTYYGDTGIDEGWGIACDELNNIYVTGFTSSLFNITSGSPHQSTYGGGSNDAYIAKFNAAGNNLIWGTYYGGNGEDAATALRYNGAGMIYIVGNTNSTVNISTAASHQSTIASAEDGYFAKFDINGVQQWGSYFGGDESDYIYDLFINSNQEILFCGNTLSTYGISTTGAYQQTIANTSNYDAFLAKFSGSGNQLIGTYYGGIESENSRAISMDSQGKVYLAGETTSSVGVSNASSTYTNYNGAQDAFMAKFCLEGKRPITPAGTSSICLGGSVAIAAPIGYQSYLWNTSQTTSSIVVNYTTAIGSFTYFVTVVDDDGCDGYSDTIQINVLDCSTAIIENNTLESIKIYPNPTENNLTINAGNSDSFITITLFDVYGKTILHKEFKGEENVNLQSFSEGVYFLELKQEGKKQTKKIIKQ